MNFLFPMLTIILIFFIIYSLNIINLDKKHYIILLLISFIVIMPILKYENLGLPILLLFLIMAIYFKTRKLTQSIITILLSLVILIIVDTISIILFFNVFMLSSVADIRESFVYYVIFYSLEFLFSLFICFIFKKSFRNKLILHDLNFKKSFSIFLITSLFITFVIFYINTALFMDINQISKQQEILNLFMFSLYFILLILIYRVLYKNIKKETELTNRKNEFENLQEYTRNMESFYKEMRKFKHDYINILASLSGYIESDDMKGLKKHFEENIMSLSENIKKRDFKLDLLQNIKILELKGVISSKVITAYEKNINVFIDIPKPVENISMDIIDLCRVIGILLDNAIEASQNTPSKSVEFGLISNENSVTIVVTNSCSEDVPPIFKVYESGFSTKGNDRGLGLTNLKEIISSYNSVFLDTSIEGEKFIQVLEIRSLQKETQYA